MDSSQNNPFNSFSSGGTGPNGFSSPATFGTGDDIILNSSPKKSKKGLIIGIVIAAVVLIGIGAAYLLLRGNGTLSTSNTGKENFYRYINYLLYGEDSTTELTGEYDADATAEIYAMLSSDHKKMVPYADNLNSFWNGFSDTTNNFVLDNEVTKNDYDKRVKFIVTYFDNYVKMNENKIEELAKTSTAENISKVLDDYFAQFEQYDFEEVKTFVKSGRLFYNSVIEMYQLMKESGCDLDGDAVGNKCDEQKIFGNSEALESLNDYSSDMNGAVYDIAKYLVENGWKINAELNGDAK